jgi:penicillin-binding protein 2
LVKELIITTVANGGTCYDLSLIDKLTDSSQRVLIDYKPKIRNQVEIKPSTWTAIHNGMRRVVLSKPYYEDLGVNVAGKTGTAQESKSRANHALFVGYAPFENPEISISTRIAFGYASDYAAELSRDVFKYYYNLEAKDDLITGTAELPSAQVTAGD